MSSIDSVTIVGGGAASSTLGTFLAREGLDVVVFYKPTDRSIAIGESLVPGVIPILRDLGVEDTVESYSQLKPGAGFTLDTETQLDFPFDEIPGTVEDYAYNVPRKQFNETLRSAAREAGVTYVDALADLESEGDTLRLGEETLEKTNGALDGQPDFIVDATGRTRLVASFLGLPYRTGPRSDTALFTHLEELPESSDGTVYTDLLDYGWCWRIPLADRTSFGVVMDTERLNRYGKEPEEQLETLRSQNEHINAITEGSQRLEPVYSFNNYQLVTERLYGTNWALVGDAAGFVDPVFSTGLFLGMDGARRLAAALLDESESALATYQSEMLSVFETWMEIIQRFYDGRLMTLLETGQEVQGTWLGSLLNPHMEKHMGRIFTGRAAESRYGIWLLKFMCDYGLKGNDPAKNRIQSMGRKQPVAVGN